jgi:septal ring factor EnvC (AmiA/AmiB activator)
LFVLVLACHGSAMAEALAAPAKELAAVKSDIQSLRDDVNLNKASKETLFKQLKKQSHAVSELNNELNILAKKLNKQSIELSKIALKKEQQQQSKSEQWSALNEQIRTAFINGQPTVMKVLLNQQNPATLSRSIVYYQYFHQARQQQLSNITEVLQNLTVDQKRLLAAKRKQQQLYTEQESKQAILKTKAKQRQDTLAMLDKKITSQYSRLQLLQEQELSLQAILHSLDKHKKKDSVVIIQPKKLYDFAKRAGSLTWPKKGKLLAHYGSPRILGRLTWQGIMIAASSGDKIIAAAPGRVVFADWLRGFGLLLIIDHGDQYMTLYGNNESLLKQVGDEVGTSDLIAYSGEKDVRQQVGLYFEIRYKGSPTNPMKWLRKQS